MSTQFVVLTDWNSEAVLDRETGLVWEQAPVTESIGSNWFEARQRCLNSTKGGRKGWRMPSIAELTTLVDPSVTSQTPLPAGHPFVYSAAPGSINAWSATTNAQFPPNAWTLSFLGGFVRDDSAKTSFTFVRCVRGGMNADA